MKLRRNEYCPIHRSLFCCGREQSNMERRLSLGIQRIEDPHHPRGYRELRSPAEMRKVLNRKGAEQGGKCVICHKEFTDYSDIVPDHRKPKGMEKLGEMIIQTISKPHTSGATKKKDQHEWTADDRLTGQCALILDRGQLSCRTISEMFQAEFQLIRQAICIPRHDLLVPEERPNWSKEQLSFPGQPIGP